MSDVWLVVIAILLYRGTQISFPNDALFIHEAATLVLAACIVSVLIHIVKQLR
jgi:hypothetical protein